MSNKDFGKKLAIGFLVLLLVEGLAAVIIWRMLSDPNSRLAKDFASWTEHSSSSSSEDATQDFPTEASARTAISRSNRVLFLVPDDVESLSVRARAYSRLGENELALQDFLKVNRLDPGKPLWLNFLAGALYSNNKKAEAAETYGQAYEAELKFAKDSPEMKYVRWHPLLEQVICYIDMDEREKALSTLDKVSLSDKRIDAQTLIPAYLRLGKYEQVLDYNSKNKSSVNSEELAQALILSADLSKTDDISKLRKVYQEQLAREELSSSTMCDMGNLLVISQKDKSAARKLYARAIPGAEIEQSNEFEMGRKQLFALRCKDILAYSRLSGDGNLYKKTALSQLKCLDNRLRGDNTAVYSRTLPEIYQLLPDDKKPELLSMWQTNVERIDHPEYKECIAYCRLSALPREGLSQKLAEIKIDSLVFPKYYARLYSTAGDTASAVRLYERAIKCESNALEKLRIKLELDEILDRKEELAKDMKALADADPNADKLPFENLRWSFAENNYRLYKAAKYLGKTKEADLYLRRAAALGNYNVLDILINSDK